MAAKPIIDAWIQHPSPALASAPMFDSLRRWVGADQISEIPTSMTTAAMKAAGVTRAMLTALMPSEPGRPIPYLDHVAAEFPELVIVGGHIGYPWTTEMIALLA